MKRRSGRRCFCEWEKWERTAAFGELSAQMRGTDLERASRETCESRRKDASTDRTAQKKATLLAFGEIGYGGGLGEVASAAVIG